MFQQLWFQALLCHLGIEDVVVEVVLHAEQLHICAQCHFAHAVCMEVELVLLKVLKVLHHRQQLLQGLQHRRIISDRCPWQGTYTTLFNRDMHLKELSDAFSYKGVSNKIPSDMQLKNISPDMNTR